MSLETLKSSLPSLNSIKSTVGMAPSLPKTYKAAVWQKADDKLTIEERELNQPEPGQVLIKVLANGVCHTDALVRSGAMGNSL